MTSQRLYAILRKAGIPEGKPYGDVWFPGALIEDRSGAIIVSYKVCAGGEYGQRRAMEHHVTPALQAAGIRGTVSADGLVFRVEE